MAESISEQILWPLDTIQGLLEKFPRSPIFQSYLFAAYENLLYGNLITNIFDNLDQKLETSQAKILLREFETERSQAKEALKCTDHSPKIEKKNYVKLTRRITNTISTTREIISEIEKSFDLKKAEARLRELKIFAAQVETGLAFEERLQMEGLENYLQSQKELPPFEKIIELTNTILVDSTLTYSNDVLTDLERRKARMLTARRKDFKGFEKRVFDRWKKAFDEFECLLQICHDIINGASGRVDEESEETNKKYALFQIFARSIQIGHEIYALLKAGFADGANARWRTLHELTVISVFLKDNNEAVSKRYLDHNVVKSYKQANDYERYRRQLGYEAIENLAEIERKYQEICKSYNDDFKGEYGWIPSTLIKDRTFRGLEQKVGMDHLHPYYNLACNAVHGGSKGFYRLGVIEDKQKTVVAIGPSNYGFADPLQLSVQSLTIITSNLLMLNMDYRKLVTMRLMQHYVRTTTEHAVAIQDEIKKLDKELRKENFPNHEKR